jgi:hypothetical protein
MGCNNLDWAAVASIWSKGSVGKPEERDRLEVQSVDGIRVDLRDIGWRCRVQDRIGFSWLRIGTGCGLL